MVKNIKSLFINMILLNHLLKKLVDCLVLALLRLVIFKKVFGKKLIYIDIYNKVRI